MFSSNNIDKTIFSTNTILIFVLDGYIQVPRMPKNRDVSTSFEISLKTFLSMDRWLCKMRQEAAPFHRSSYESTTEK